MSDVWEYDRLGEAITVRTAIGRHRLVALRVKPHDGRAIMDMVAIVREVAEIHDPDPLPYNPNCKCLRCSALRVLAAIGGEA